MLKSRLLIKGVIIKLIAENNVSHYTIYNYLEEIKASKEKKKRFLPFNDIKNKLKI